MNKFELAERTVQQKINSLTKKLEDAIAMEDYSKASVYKATIDGMYQVLNLFQTIVQK